MSRLGELLVNQRLITRDQLDEALAFQKANGGRLGSCLVKLKYVHEDDLTNALSRQYGIPCINLSYFEMDPEIIKLLPRDVALKYQVVPLSKVGTALSIAIADPNNVVALDELKFMTGLHIETLVASESQVREALERAYGTNTDSELRKVIQNLSGGAIDTAMELVSDEEAEVDIQSLERESEEAPIVRLVNLILLDSMKRGASDIHIEPYERECRVRFRVDGVLQTVMKPPLKLRDRPDLTHQDHVEARHFREAAAPGRSHQDSPECFCDEVQGLGFPRFVASHALWRESRAQASGQGKPDVRHAAAGF